MSINLALVKFLLASYYLASVNFGIDLIINKWRFKMKTITLKLTEKEYMMFKSNLPVEEGCTSWIDSYQLIEKSNSHHLKVLKKDKFNKFIKIISPFSVNFKNIKSKFDKAELRMEIDKELDKNFPDGQKIDYLQNTLYKLDKAVVQNDEPKERIFKTEKELISFLRLNANEDATDEWLVDNSYQLGEWKKLDNGDILHRWESDGGVQNDEPKCTKCGSEFEDEIWKTPATDYEEYICSNDKCCAVHTINIETHQFQPQLDIERFWDTLEFSYIWEQGLKKDEPKSYVGIATNEVTYDMLPKECFIVNIMDHKALDKGELVEIIRVRIGENGFYKGYDGVDSWDALNKLNKDVYGITDLNVVKVMANQSMHGNYQSEIKYHNEKVNKS